ncbi:MAG: hypothetical protein V1750_04420, partial [Acidobacteriota bacterium]
PWRPAPFGAGARDGPNPRQRTRRFLNGGCFGARWGHLICALLLAAAAICTRDAGAQAASEWLTGAGLPVAVVEIAGGDLEHLVAFMPPGAAFPESVAGWPLARKPRRGGELWALEVPAALATVALADLAPLLASGCTAVVALGPAPARELESALKLLEGVAHVPLAPHACVLADGGIEARRGLPERVDLVVTAPPPEDQRFAQLPALALWLEGRLGASHAGARVELDSDPRCSRLVFRVASEADHPRAQLERLRQELQRLASERPDDAELARIELVLRRQSAGLAASPRALAAALAERLAVGGQAARGLVVATSGAADLSALSHEVLAGHAGFATLWISERRAVGEAPEALENGLLLSWQWLPDDLFTVAIAFGGLDLLAARGVTAALATLTSRRGWSSEIAELGGVVTLAVAAPSDEVAELLEVLGTALATPPPPAEPSPISQALGLAAAPTAEAMSVALALPPEIEEGVDAARKFLGAIPGGGLRSGAVRPSVQLLWTAGAGTPQLTGLADLPPTAAGWVAREVLSARFGSTTELMAFPLAAAEGPMLAVKGAGEAHVPALDARLAAQWDRARLPARPEEVAGAVHNLVLRLYGGLLRATARRAARTFLAGLPEAEALLAVSAAEVSQVLAALPAWRQLLRLGEGPAPLVVTPPVRKSPSPRKTGPV